MSQWVVETGLLEGEFLFDLANPDTGEANGILDLAWPDGTPEGLSAQFPMLLHEPEEIETAANRTGYRFFTDVVSIKCYEDPEVLIAEGMD